MIERTNNSSGSVQSVDRALLLLDILAVAGGECSIKYLSEKSGLHKSTVYRLLQTLVQHNYVRQNEETEEYCLGYQILSLSSKMINTLDIRKVARPYLQDLCTRVGQVVQLSVLQGKDAIFIDKVEPPDQSIRMYSEIGKSIPVYCSSSGKVLLAWQKPAVINWMLGEIEFQSFTKTTITDAETLRCALEEVREEGFGTDWFEHEEGIFCVAAPVFDIRNHVVAAIGIAGTILQLSPKQVVQYAQLVSEKANCISRELGCIQPPAIFRIDRAQADVAVLTDIVHQSPIFNAVNPAN